jgi:hypothetical protein
MELNAAKTSFLMFMQESSHQLHVRDSVVQSCTYFKYLGIYIDYDLSWRTHANHVVQKVQKTLYILHRCSGASNQARRRLLFRAYIYPHFLYGISLYMFCSVALRAKLEGLLRRCCRLVLRDTGLFPVVSSNSLYHTLDILPLRLLFQHTSAVLLYHVLVLADVPSLRPLFTRLEPTAYNSRRIPVDLLTLRLPRVTTERGKQNFAYWGAKLWNSVPPEIRRAASAAVFSNMYSMYLRLRIDQALCTSYELLAFI